MSKNDQPLKKLWLNPSKLWSCLKLKVVRISSWPPCPLHCALLPWLPDDIILPSPLYLVTVTLRRKKKTKNKFNLYYILNDSSQLSVLSFPGRFAFHEVHEIVF